MADTPYQETAHTAHAKAVDDTLRAVGITDIYDPRLRVLAARVMDRRQEAALAVANIRSWMAGGETALGRFVPGLLSTGEVTLARFHEAMDALTEAGRRAG